MLFWSVFGFLEVIMSLYILECFWLFRGDYELVLEEE
jgi:hypothetical protein